MHQVSDCVLLSILKKVQFCLQKAEIKNDFENVDCEVYKKPDVMKFIPDRTRKSFPVPTIMICWMCNTYI